jgi:hypothetical protein
VLLTFVVQRTMASKGLMERRQRESVFGADTPEVLVGANEDLAV